MSPSTDPRVTFYTRAGCHLCDEARLVLQRVCDDLGEAYVELDVDHEPELDPDLRARYSGEVPVTLVDGVQHDFWRVDETRLRAALGVK